MNFSDLSYMMPEIIVSITVLLMVALDLFTPNKKSVAGLGILGLFFAFVAGIMFMNTGKPVHIFSSYAIDLYSLYFKFLILAAGILGMFMAASYRKMKDQNEGEFYYLMMSMVLGMMFLVSSTDLILIYVAIEFISLTSYILVGFLKDDNKSSEGSLKYFLIGAVSSGVMLYGMSFIYGLSGTTNIIAIAKIFATATPQPLFFVGGLFMLAGFGFKIALAPFHFWSPDAYEGAPTPVTALLSVGPKCAAFAVFGRVFYSVFPGFVTAFPNLITMIGILTMTLGNTAAIFQKDIKRMFAYSSIAQAGYIFIGIAAGPAEGFMGMMFYLMAYIFMNLGAFAIIVMIGNRTGSSDISAFAGVAKKYPYLAAAFMMFFLSLAGIPPTAGFMGKYFLFMGALKTQFYALALFGVINSVISVYYYFNVVKTMYFDEQLPQFSKQTADAPNDYIMLHAVIAACLAFTLFVGLFPESFINITRLGVNLLN